MAAVRRGRRQARSTRASSRLSKTVPPRLPAVFPRERLFARLDEALAAGQRAWIEGPPGAGKTTLAASWLDARGLPCVWYQADATDHDPASLFHYLGIAVAQAAPRHRRPLPKLMPEFRGDLRAFARNFFGEAGRRLPASAVLVFDDLHELNADSPLFEILREGLEALPVGPRALLLSRAAPPQAFARWRLEQRLGVLDWRSLQLDEAESVGLVRFLERQGRRNTPPAIVHSLHRECDGWLAGLLLLLERTAAGRPPRETFDAVSAQRLFDYFAGEVFDRRDAGARAFLMETALFPAFTAEMAEELTGRPAQPPLSDLVRHNHFTERRAETSPIYQYHPLFRTFLLEQGKAAWSSRDLARRRSDAAGILERAGQLEEALALYLECRDTAGATRMILAQAPALCAAGRLEFLGTAVRSLPPEALQGEPWLVYWLGVSIVFFDPAEGERHFSTAYDRFEERGDAAGAWLAWAGVVDAIWQPQRDWTGLDAWVARLEAKLRREGGFPSEEVASRVVSSLFWTLHWRAPHHPEMERWAREAARLWDRTDDPSIRLRLGLALQHHHIYAANASRLALLTETQRRLAKRTDIPPGVLVLACRADVLASCLACAPLAETLGRTREALDLAARRGIRAFDAMLCGCALTAVLGAEDLPKADEWLEAFHAAIASHPTSLDTALYQVFCSWRARLRNEPARAVEWAGSALEIARGVGAYNPEMVCHYALAHAHLASRDLERAQRENELTRSSARAANAHWWVYLCTLFDASAAFAGGDEALGVQRLRAALEIQARLDIAPYLFLWSRKATEQLCLKAFEHGLATPYVRRLIEVYDIRPADPPVHVDEWPFPVKVYTLGRFSLLRDGKPVRFAGKAQKKPLELLRALVALGGRDVREDRLADALWPGADGDGAIRSLGITLHRLRKVCGDRAIRRSEGRLTLDPRCCWVDAWALERQLAALERAAPEALSRGAERLLDLYRGPFLGDDADHAWALSARERLRSKFLRALESVGMALGKAGDHEAAMRCFRRGLDVDPLAESFYRCLMRCCLALGRRAEAASAYERCRRMLGTHLGVPPSPETDALYRQARAA